MRSIRRSRRWAASDGTLPACWPGWNAELAAYRKKLI
jgi:hypothetical protein